MFNKILIANRGEIAVRVIKACQELGIRTVAVYSEADRTALHVQMADEAVLLGPPPPLESYLNIDKIIAIAHQTETEAIHPGYGFLAENSAFAERCEQEGIVFIGPNSKAMALVGDKLRSRQTMSAANIPIIPGMQQKVANYDRLKIEAEKIGYPVILKASAGGGGKGMRIVHSPAELKDAMEAGMREAKSAFGDESIYLEKFIEQPRHVEFQVIADHHGNVVHLFERECSIQRRHQKIIEESPSTALDDELRSRMGETAKRVIKESGYTNAGTVEFLLDKNKNFYFLEVNARIQVEHPVTEFVTGIDLVKQQIRIAAGEPLPFCQEDLQQRGHAIECRIYAEDPENNFLPSLGTIHFVQEPTGPWVRVDSGLFSGIEVSMYYDPILSKLIVWGQNRNDAIQRMKRALDNYVILGIKTQIPFLKAVIEHPEFVRGNINTNFLTDHFANWRMPELDAAAISKALAIAAIHEMTNSKKPVRVEKSTHVTPWNTIGYWEILSS
ncbi:MAG: acetyl-CoA carboxylase biotin carboxylase subunit [candidate division KSB1 bacterium]|nr:acetyl-CoA carboxylase biotin carboxylase subunit [candidate division KSB1 bacterium]MDZ7399388.1 acetyl-CoA carboxylase biotin carboxylase subunit [candidate division KSB1 bacterium]